MWESNKVFSGNHFSNEVGLNNNLCHAIENRLSCVPSHGNMAARLYEEGGVLFTPQLPPRYMEYGVRGRGGGVYRGVGRGAVDIPSRHRADMFIVHMLHILMNNS